MAKVSNQVQDFKKELHHLGGGRLGHTIGIFGVVEGFKAAIENAQKTREEARKLGTAIDEGTASVARYGDAWDSIWKGVKNGATTALSIFTRAGENMATVAVAIKEALTGGNFDKSISDQQKYAKIAEDTESNLARLAKAREKIMEENSPEKLAEAQKKLAETQAKHALAQLTEEERINRLLNEQLALREKIKSVDKVGNNKALGIQLKQKLVENQDEVDKLITESDAKNKERTKERETLERERRDALRDKAEIERKHMDALHDPYKKTVAELAGQNASGFGTSLDSARFTARKVEALKLKAQAAYEKGNFKGGDAITAQMEAMKSGISGKVKSTETETERAYKSALEKSEEKLGEISKKLDGIIKAQP